MSTHADFLASIIANPDADEPRLVYADWLEENGEPKRAEFIRVQCELARCECSQPELIHLAPCQKCEMLYRRERELLDTHKGITFHLPIADNRPRIRGVEMSNITFDDASDAVAIAATAEFDYATISASATRPS